MENIIPPNTLNNRCSNAVLFPFLLLFAEEIIVVTQVPIFCPTVIKHAADLDTDPVNASVWSIETEADELDKIIVTTAPIIIAKIGICPIILKEEMNTLDFE